MGELRATEHTMMLREVAFINTQGSGPSPANNRGNGDGGQWVWSVGKARMTPSMTIAEQAVGGGGGAQGGWGLGTKQYKLLRPCSHNKGQWILLIVRSVSHCSFHNFCLAPTPRDLFCSIYWKLPLIQRVLLLTSGELCGLFGHIFCLEFVLLSK